MTLFSLSAPSAMGRPASPIIKNRLIRSVIENYSNNRESFQTMSQKKTVDPKLWPLCGKPNKCTRAACNAAENSWCSKVVFSKDLLDSVPEEAKRKACICWECVEEAV